MATTKSWSTVHVIPRLSKSGISLSKESKPQGPSRKGGSVQARCRESGGAHGLKTIGVIPVKESRRCLGADNMQFLLHTYRTRHQSKHCLRKAMAPTVANSPPSRESIRFRLRGIQSKITSLCLVKTSKRGIFLSVRRIICRTLRNEQWKAGTQSPAAR